jgi:hypothetical protein
MAADAECRLLEGDRGDIGLLVVAMAVVVAAAAGGRSRRLNADLEGMDEFRVTKEPSEGSSIIKRRDEAGGTEKQSSPR